MAERTILRPQHFATFARPGTYRDAYYALKERGTTAATLPEVERLAESLNRDSASRALTEYRDGFYFALDEIRDNRFPFMVLVGKKFEISSVNSRKEWGNKSYVLIK